MVQGSHNNAKVLLRAAPAGMGIRAGRIVVSICDVLGIRDCVSKVFGRQNKYSQVLATFKAFENHRTLKQISRARGKAILDVNEIMRNKRLASR